MVFKSQSPDIDCERGFPHETRRPFTNFSSTVPKNQTLWTWLFESNVSKLQAKDLQGFTDVVTKQHVSYYDLKKYAEYFSAVLFTEYGFREGDVVVVCNKNSVWYPVIALAAVRIGAVACGVSPEYTIDELTYALRLTKAKLLFTGAENFEKATQAALNIGLSIERLMLIGGMKQKVKSIEDILETAKSSKSIIPVRAFKIPEGKENHDFCAYLCLSSGTTGLPKAVMISHANIIAQCLQIQQITPRDHDKVLGALPFYHITGIVHEIHLPIILNAHVYVLPTYTLDSLLRTVSDHKIRELLVVPPILIRLVHDKEIVPKYDLSHVTRFSSGAAPLPKEILILLEQKFPGTGFKQGYGMTESTSAITSHPPSKYAYKYADKVGMVVGSTEVKIVDPSTGAECGVGKAGEVWVRGPQVAMGYLDNPKATTESLDSDDFLHTGDIGYFDELGLLSITDRMKEMIKVKGIGVAPAELEDLLLGHSFVSDVAVCGIPDSRAGERPKAFVVLFPSLHTSPVIAARELISFVKTKKARHKWVVEVEIVKEIPKSPAGKILRRKLRQRLAGEQGIIIVRDESARAKL